MVDKNRNYTQADMLEKNPNHTSRHIGKESNYTQAHLLGKNPNHKRPGDTLKKDPNTKLQ
jgi:hypothetical protein